MHPLVYRTPRPGAEPMRGPTAARWYLRFFRDPVRTLVQARERFVPVCAVGNVVPLPLQSSADRDTALEQAEELLLAQGVVQRGDFIVLTIGEPMGQPGGTNTLKIVRVGH